MNKKVVESLMKAYLKLRKLWDPLIRPIKVQEYYKLSRAEFSNKINSYEYKPDYLKGLLDHTGDPNEFFNEDCPCRDCDDFQRQWSWWGTYNGFDSTEYVVCDYSAVKTAFSTMHVVGTLHKGSEWYLTNYRYYGPFLTEEEALNFIDHWKSYAINRACVRYRSVSEEAIS